MDRRTIPVYQILILLLLTKTPILKGQTTNFVDKESKLLDFSEKGWFIDTIPFLEVPVREIEEVYYYRWASHKRHLRYTAIGAGYSVTEFVHKVGYSQKFDTINAAAGHHIYESRWLRNGRYVQDYINFWAKEGGGNQQYSEWIADASYANFLIDGDIQFITSLLPHFINNFEGWNDHFEPLLGLYFITPHDDAQENSAASVQTLDPYHGGLGYRPSFNSEMVGNAFAISLISELRGDKELSEKYGNITLTMRENIMKHLWDDERSFFYHVQRENNPSLELLDTREEVGFDPWRWGVPSNESKYGSAWAHLFDTKGFNSLFGPTTAEQRSKWYDGDQVSQCCWWNGNSWPYSTSHTLSSLAAQIRDYFVTEYANINNYVLMLHKYAMSQYKDGKPYVAECHSPGGDFWVCDAFNHSEHYAHSTYIDNVLSDLIGIRGVKEEIFVIHPLIPQDWPYFIVENVLYHGHNLTVLYDADGTKYNTGRKGMQIYLNGVFVASQDLIGPMQIEIPPPTTHFHTGRKNKVENYGCNVDSRGYPEPDASFTSPFSSTWHGVDGRIFYDYNPLNRWTNYGSPNPTDWFSIHFGPGRAIQINQVKIYIYSDVVTGQGRVDCPESMQVEIWNSTNESWITASNQTLIPEQCSSNDVNIINFDSVKTESFRIIFTRDEDNDYYVGLTEIEVWASYPQNIDYEAEDAYNVNTVMKKSSFASRGSYIGEINQEKSSVEFTGLWADIEGIYLIKIFYSNPAKESSLNFIVNNLQKGTLFFPSTNTSSGEFSENNFVIVNAEFVYGNNNIIIRNEQVLNFIEIDMIRILDHY